MAWIMDNLVLVGVLLGLSLLIVIIIVIGLAMRANRRAKKTETAPSPSDAAPKTGAEGVPIDAYLTGTTDNVDTIVARVAGVRPGRDAQAPIVALVGVPGAATAAIADAASLDVPLNLKTPAAPHSQTRVVMTGGGAVVDFGDTLLEGDQWHRTWREALRGLRKTRPERPLDAVVFAVPAFAMTDLGEEGQTAMAQLGERFGSLLGEIQAQSGLRVPVYLIITAVDQRPEFAALRDMAARDGAQHMTIGWSSPHPLDANFDPRWVQEAVIELTDALDLLSVDGLVIAAPNEEAAAAERMSCLSNLPLALSQPLNALIGAMMRSSEFTDAMMLRGVYLGGGGETESGQPAAFAHQLFVQKIFPETRLVQPARGYRARRSRAARRWQAATAVASLAGIGLLAGLAISEDDNADLRELLSRVSSSVQDYIRFEANNAVPSQQFLERETEASLRAMSGLAVNDLATPLAPLSYLSPLQQDVSEAVAVGLDLIVLRALRDGLKNRNALIVDSAFANAPLTLSQIETWSASLAEFDRMASLFGGLREGRQASDLSEISNYAIGFLPPPGFEDNYEIYGNALADTLSEPLDRNELRNRLTRGQGRDLLLVYGTVYQQSALAQAVNGISLQANWLLRNASASNPDVIPVLDELVRDIEAVEDILAGTSENWLDMEAGGFDQRVQATIDSLSNLSFAPPDVIGDLRDRVSDSRRQALSQMVSQTGFLGRPVIVREGDVLRLNPIYPRLRTAIDQLINTEQLLTMPSSGDPGRPQGISATRFAWSSSQLEQASAIADRLMTLSVSAADDIPSDLLSVLMEIGRARVEQRIIGLIQQARRPFESSADLAGGITREEGRAFALAAPVLGKLKNQTDLLGMGRASATIDATAGQQAQRLLLEISGSLESAQPYTPSLPGVSAWQGQANSAARLFGLASDAELVGVLNDWRSFIQTLADDQAAPIIGYLEQQSTALSTRTAALISQWRDISTTLGQYAASVPRNPLTALERFILVDMNTITLETCPDVLSGITPGGGYFGDKLTVILAALEGRCTRATLTGIDDAYASIADAFNISLAGEFPFVGIGEGVPLADQTLLQNPADPVEVQRFFEQFQTSLARLREAEASSPIGRPLQPEANRFLSNLELVRRFLQGNAENFPRDLAFSVNFDFRTNRRDEQAADQIIDWTLQIGDDTLTALQEPRPLLWRPGDPISLSLRWARNAPNVPVDPRRANVAVNGLTATYRYDDPWALFSMIAANTVQAAEIRFLSNAAPSILRLSLPLDNNPDPIASGGQSAEEAVIFARLGVRPLGREQAATNAPAVALPQFPSRGPL